jgi:DNA polymerase III epsilon subunit-like protein
MFEKLIDQIIVLDLETSGVNLKENGILSIGAVVLSDLEKKLYLECRLDDDRKISPYALKVNGFTEEECRDPKKMTEEEAVDRLLNWATNQNKTLFACCNTPFDLKFIERVCDSRDNWKIMRRAFDIPSAAAMIYGEVLSHKKICENLGLPEEPLPHNGLSGAMSEAECILNLLA